MIEVRPPKLLPEPDGTAGLTKCRRAPTTKTTLPSEKGAGATGSVALRNPICEWRGVEQGRLDRVIATTRLGCEGNLTVDC